MRAKKLSFAVGAAVVAMLMACGDDVSNVTEVNEIAALEMVKKYKELPKCEESIYGSLIYVEDSSQVYTCTPSGWSSLKGEKGDKGDKGDEGKAGKNGENGENGKDGKDGSSCTATVLTDGSGIEVKCDGKVVGTIKNGADGAKGADGENGTNGEDGKDGVSCTTKPVENGIEVSCPGSEPVIITNGKNGADGTNGTNGVNGKSAYEIAKDGGYKGTEAEWLASLKGKDGTNGTNGVNGKSAYEIAKAAGYKGTEAEWLASLKGKDGSSCTATELDDKSGYKIVCGGNSVGVVLHGRDASSDVMIDGRDKKIYKIVKIGNQTWMAENLNYAPESGSYCYKNNDANCAKYGRLYTWASAKEACPTGWHLPSHSEWLELFKAVGGSAAAGRKLKTSNGWNGTDDYGFSALPSGFWEYTGHFSYEGSETYLWSSTPTDVYAFVLRLNKGESVYMASLYKTNAYSVRCLKDK